MIRITYVSREVAGLTSDQLLALISQCHRNNPSKGLTGMLLHGNGTFLQVLEGDEQVIDSLMTAIAQDSRHTDMTIVQRESVTTRQFDGWSMGFEQVTDESLKSVPGLHNFGLPNFTPEYLSDHNDVVDTLLERHRAPHWDPLIRELDARDKLIAELRRELLQMRNDKAMAALVLESMIDVASKGRINDAHLDICRTALRSMR
jgi:uncharacterized protein YaaQ